MSGPKEEEITPGKDPHAVGEGQGLEKFKHHMAECAKHLAAGNIEEAKKHHEEAMKHAGYGMKHMAGVDGVGVGDVKSEDYQKSMSNLQSQVDELHTQMARFAGMVSELMEAEKAEGHDLEHPEDEEGGGHAGLRSEIEHDKENQI